MRVFGVLVVDGGEGEEEEGVGVVLEGREVGVVKRRMQPCKWFSCTK